MKTIVLLIVFGILFLLSFSITVFAGNDSVENQYFTINIPDNWTYIEYSHTPQSQTTGFGPGNQIWLTPSEFSDILLSPDSETYSKKIEDGGVIAVFAQDTNYRLKNAPLESYVKYQIDNYGISNITSQQYTTLGNEKSVRIYANETAFYGDNNTKIALYVVMHDEQPYAISYIANAKNYEKYLPEFEQMVKSFRFVGSPSEMENENQTNTTTNFSGANLSELSTNNKSQEELYNECVNVAGKSLCDFLFKR
jgi:hypothetical protein